MAFVGDYTCQCLIVVRYEHCPHTTPLNEVITPIPILTLETTYVLDIIPSEFSSCLYLLSSLNVWLLMQIVPA